MITHRSTATPTTSDSEPSVSREAFLRRLWATLHPAQRALIDFVYRYESTGLTYQAIASRIELPTLPGQGITPSSGGRLISDKTVRKHCEPLLAAGLLIRHGARGAIQLSPDGHDLRHASHSARSE